MAWWSNRRVQRGLFYGVMVGGAIFVLCLLQGALSSFVLAAVLVYLLSPMVDAVEKKGTSRVVSILIVYLAMAIIAVALGIYGIPKMVDQLNTLADAVPTYTKQIQDISETVQERYSKAGLPQEMREIADGCIKQVEQRILAMAERAIESLLGLFGHILNIILAPVLAFYLLKDMRRFKTDFARLLPKSWRMDALELLRDINQVLKSYVQGYLLVALIVGCLMGLSLWILGVDFALTLGIFAGLMELIPYFGPFIGAIPAVALALLTSKWLAFKVVLVFFIMQQVEGNVISPKLLGDKVGLHPLAVIVFLLAGGKLYGLMGMLLAVPLAAVVKIIVSFAWRKIAS